MEDTEDGPGPSSTSTEDQKRECADTTDSEALNIVLPEQLHNITPAEEFVRLRHRWNTNEEIASILIAFDRHKEWLMLPQKIRPASGSMLLYNRKVVFYRRDGYCWKKRRNGSTIREDHMKLKVQGLECIYGSYVHSAILPTFHRRCYWLLQNPNIVLLHYLNVPYPEAAKPSISSVWSELKQKEWTKEELVDQLGPMLSQIGQSGEEDADDEKKVERILEELLPMLMPSQDGSKKSVCTSKGLTTQTLTSATSTTLNCIIAPRKSSSQAVLFQQQHQPQPDNLHLSGDHPVKTVEGHVHVPVFVNNSVPQSSHGNQNPVHITSHSPYQPILFQVPTNNLQPLVSKPVQSEASIYSVTTNAKNNIIPTQQVCGSKINFFSNDSNSLILQHHNIQNHQHCPQQIVHNAQQLKVSDQTMVNNSPIIAHLPSNSVRHSESDAEMTDSCVHHSSVTANKEQNSMVVKNQFLSLGLSNRQIQHSSHSGGMPADISAASIATMDVSSIQNKNQMAQQLFHSPDLYSKVAHACLQQPSHSQQQQQPQNLSEPPQITQQNHSQQLQTLAQNSTQAHSSSQQQSNPLLTLHLKSANASADNAGFVLSIQGASLATPESASVSETSGQHASPLNISSSNGLVFIASQNQSGQLVVNRISDSDKRHVDNNTPNQISTTGAPGAPYILSLPSSSTFVKSEAQNVSILTHQPSATFTSLGQNSSSDSHPLYSSHNTHTFSSIMASQHSQFPPLAAVACTTPLSTGLNLPATTTTDCHIMTSNSSFHNTLMSMAESSPIQTASCSSSSSAALHDPAKDASKSVLNKVKLESRNAQPSSSSMREAKDLHLSCLDLNRSQATHPGQPAAHDLMMQHTAGIFHHDKDMISNPDSCDTLDGSFSSLPTSDLDLDDFLDLHGLPDLTGSPLCPVNIPASSPSSGSHFWGNSQIPASSSMNTDTPLSCSNSAFPSLEDKSHHAKYQSHQQPSPLPTYQAQASHGQYLGCQQTSQHLVAPTSPNHPGAPPRSCPKFSPSFVSSPNPSPLVPSPSPHPVTH